MLSRTLLVAIAAVVTLAADVAAQSRLGFRKASPPAPTQTVKRFGGIRPAIAPPVAPPVAPQELQVPPRPRRGVSVSAGLTLRGDGEIHVEPRGLDTRGHDEQAPAREILPVLGWRHNPRSRRAMQTSFEAPRSMIEEELVEWSEPEDDAGHQLADHRSMPRPIPKAATPEVGNVYVEQPVMVLPTHFPYARETCRNYPFNPWLGFCFERMCRYGLADREKPGHCNPGDFWGRGVTGDCVSGGVRCAPSPSGSCRSGTFSPAAVPEQPREYPRAPRNPPPPEHLFRPENQAPR